MNKKILVVEDSRQIGNLIKGILTKQGFQVTHLLTGQDGIDIGKKGGFCLVLLDVFLPDMNGFDVFAAMKNGQDAELPAVVFLSATIDEETIQRTRDSGALGFILKPFAPESFISRLRELVPKIFSGSSMDIESNREKKFLEELRGEYITEWLEMMPEMESAFKGGRYEYISQMAHNLAGSGGTMELPFITEAGRKLSELIHQRQLEKADSLIRSIHSFFISEANK
jgi:two-component system chemotaxis response regulator CheY